MKARRSFVIIFTILIAGCSKPDNIFLGEAKYKYNEYYIFSLQANKWESWRSPLSHSGPVTSKLKIIPFILEFRNRSLYFVKYCNPIDFRGSYNPFDESELRRINGDLAIKNSCRIKELSSLDQREAINVWAYQENNGEDTNKNGRNDIKFWATIYDRRSKTFVKHTLFFSPPNVWM